MKIVLVEQGLEGQAPNERSFQQKSVKIGRDSSNCDVIFSNQDFRMVSRNHADLRCENGKWVVYDLQSTFGTFLNGQKVAMPTEITVGNSIQFGQNGPMVHVIWLESGSASSSASSVSKPSSKKSTPQVSVQKSSQISEVSTEFTPSPIPDSNDFLGQTPASTPVKDSKPSTKMKAILEFVEDKSIPPFTISKDSVWLGRDPNADVVIEASAIMVSRRHAEIRRQNGGYVVSDNNSFNGTLVNGQRISAITPIYHNDKIQLGRGGPVLTLNSPDKIVPEGAGLPGQRSISLNQIPNLTGNTDEAGSATMVFNMGEISQDILLDESDDLPLVMQVGFGDKQELAIGRNESNEISLDGLQISNNHARLKKTAQGVSVEDLNSTNGVYVNGERITRKVISAQDSVQIGSFVLRIDEYQTVGVFDTRSKTRIDSVGITKVVKNRAGKGMIRLLDDISLSIQPNEFVGFLGPSGAGKSTFMDALNGMRPATEGSVFINNLDLYQYLDSLKQSIGYVPQDDIIHRELTVYKTLYYVAKLRLSRDVSRSEIDQIIEEVLDVIGLEERRDVPINQLSGGQRKRVSIAVELITKPSIIFLDEPTSGLDPATEEKIMKLFRQIAESGRTIILTTHAMENVKLFDKIVILMRGKLVFYGKPEEALSHLGVSNFKELYDKLEEPIEQKLQDSGGSDRSVVTEHVAEDWKQKFLKTPQFKTNVYEPLKELAASDSGRVKKSHRLGVFGAIRQWVTLSRRYALVLSKDKLNLFILFAQAPIIAIMVFFVMGADQPRDFAYFALSLCSIWFGTAVASREIVRERPVYERERMVNLGILPYLGSKLFVLGIIVSIQCVVLFVPLKFLDLVGLMPMPGIFAGIPQFITMLLTAAVGIALGLFISALVKTSEMATSLIPLILIPQIIFSGLIGVPTGINKVVGLVMPATWSFDTMKRFSDLDTLEPEGALPDDRTNGLGLYKMIEGKNDKIIADAKKNIRSYEDKIEKIRLDAERRANSGEKVQFTGMPDRPKIGASEKVPKDLSEYVNFLHPWMHEILNQLVLILMFFMLFIFTLIVLRLKDIG